MTLRGRIAAVAGAAVALAVIAVAVSVYVAVRSELRSEIDQSLIDRGRPLVQLAQLRSDRGPPPFGSPLGGGRRPELNGPGRRRLQLAQLPGELQGAAATASSSPFGGASGHVQFIRPDGTAFAPPQEASSPALPTDAHDREIARQGRGRAATDVRVAGVHVRVLTFGRGVRGAVQVARPLTEVDHALKRLLIVLIIVGVAGVALALLLGAVVARTALAPIARFTSRTERLTARPDLSERLEVEGRDELARLARSFNTTLEALERSADAQRHLVADASHELRTPIASLRANIQILEEAERLPREERDALRADIISELDELTTLVGDVVELARGTKPTSARDDVRLDEIVRAAIERTQRWTGTLTFAAELEPTVVSGDPERINRAVSNLLDNARKWSPETATVSVVLDRGTLTVRDKGPGFEEHDLPHVFDRFYRANKARAQPGSGLGLAIVRQAAEAHGGFARAANHPGGGAILTVNFGHPVTDNDLVSLGI